MNDSILVARGAKFSNRLAFDVAYNKKALHGALRGNRSLPEDLWIKLYTHKPKLPLQTAEDLVSRELSEKQIDHVLEKETRVHVIAALVSGNDLTSAQQEKVFTMKIFSPLVATHWLHRRIDSTLAPKVALKAGGRGFLIWLSCQSYQDVSAAESIKLFSQWDGWSKSESEGGYLEDLLYKRPELLESYVTHSSLLVRCTAANSSVTYGQDIQERLIGMTATDTSIPSSFHENKSQKVLERLISNPNLNLNVAKMVVRLGSQNIVRAQYLEKARQRIKESYPNIESPWGTLTAPTQVEAISEYIFGENYLKHPWHIQVWRLGPVVGVQGLPAESFRMMARHVFLRYRGTPLEVKFREAYGEEQFNLYSSQIKRMPNYQNGPFGSEPSFDSCDNELDGRTARFHPADELFNSGEYVFRYIEKSFGENVKAWETFWSLADDYTGTVGELVSVCLHI